MESLREDMVIQRGVQVRFVDDVSGRMPTHLQRWIAAIHAIVAVDHQFIMKINRSRVRILMQRSGDHYNDALMDREIRTLREILSVLAVDPSLDSTLNMLATPQLDPEAEQLKINADHWKIFKDV